MAERVCLAITASGIVASTIEGRIRWLSAEANAPFWPDSTLSISMKLFKRLRHSRPEPDDWFIPIKGFAPNVLFFGGDGRSFEGKLQQVSESAMDIVFAKQPDTDHPLNFIISIEGIGYVDGRVQPRALSAGTNGFVGRMDICDMSLDGKRKWCEAIKNYSHLAARPEQAA